MIDEEIEWGRAILRAETLLSPLVRKTPLIHSPGLTARCGRPVYLKLENLQRSCSFKFRPAVLNILAHQTEARNRGVVTSSSGNFAGAVALAAQEAQVRATIVMRPSASSFKLKRVRNLGAEIVFCDDDYAAREERVKELIDDRGLIHLHPHDSIETISADATVGFEILQQEPSVQEIMVPASGAGLLAGTCLAVAARKPDVSVLGVQPQANGSLVRSLDAGAPVMRSGIKTVADGLTAAKPGKLGFGIVKRLVQEVKTVSEAALIAATRLVFEEEGLMVEPAGVACLAALMEYPDSNSRAVTAMVVTGGNVDPASWAEWVLG